MKIKLKTYDELKDLVIGDSNKKLDDRLENFFRKYANTEIEPTNVNVIYINNDTKLTFDFFPKDMLYTSWKIPQDWTSSIDLEENKNLYFCKFCNYTFNEKQLYPFRSGKNVTIDNHNTDDVTDDTTTSSEVKTFKWMMDNNEDIFCPICFKKNSFVSI